MCVNVLVTEYNEIYESNYAAGTIYESNNEKYSNSSVRVNVLSQDYINLQSYAAGMFIIHIFEHKLQDI